ncbi:hypothetical protein [Proteus mirabilis]|uniref:hypothetical protein n=1 Tax=Proteus mirabilis TaxID=584 RepID=UPI00228D91D5|nr:hypothetical protein [Proteus mirabilis]
MKLTDVITDCINLKLSGSAVDSMIQCLGGNVLQERKPVLTIEMLNKEELLWMMCDANDVHVYISADVLHINALYKPTTHFPAARIYFMKSSDLFLFARIGSYLENNGVKLNPIDDTNFSKLIDDVGYMQRYKVWSNKRNMDSNLFNGLLGGRLKNTSVNQGVWLSSNGKCLVCGVETDRVATSTIYGDSGIMIGMQLCLEHEVASQDKSTLLNYLSEHLGGRVIFSKTSPLTIEECLEQTCDVLKTSLECSIIKVDGNTVTARRHSGITIVIRQHSLSNYAYNILSAEGKALSRVDSADHHDIFYGPDHVHYDLRKSKKNIVETSFTYGDVGLDIKLLLKLVQEAEKNCKI